MVACQACKVGPEQGSDGSEMVLELFRGVLEKETLETDERGLAGLAFGPPAHHPLGIFDLPSGISRCTSCRVGSVRKQRHTWYRSSRFQLAQSVSLCTKSCKCPRCRQAMYHTLPCLRRTTHSSPKACVSLHAGSLSSQALKVVRGCTRRGGRVSRK